MPPPANAQEIRDFVCMMVLCPLILLAGIRWETPVGWRKPMTLLGDCSYPIYAIHYPLIPVFSLLGKKLHLPAVATMVLFVLGCMALSIIAGRFFDAPIRRWANRKLRARRSASPALV